MLTTRFENIMLEDETISEYNNRIYDISNKSLTLEDPIANAKLVSKVLRFLPDRYCHESDSYRRNS